MAHFFKYFFGIWSMIFLLFAYWQGNDPDSLVWVIIYGLAAVFSALAFFERYYVPVLLLVTAAGLIGGIYFFPASVGDWISQEWQQADLSMKTVNMEEARESFGLLIVSLIMGLASFRGWVGNRSGKQ